MIKKYLYLVLWLCALVAIGAALLYVESDLLWKVQQYNLFLYSSLFFKQTMVVPGGMLSYLGAFFTQFFYYPWMGVVMLCGWWLLLMWLTKRAFIIDDRWWALALIPVAILLTANTELGYWIYSMKLRGYYFMPTIGTTVAVALLWAYRKLTATPLWLRIAYVVTVVLVGYPLMGVYALAAALLMAVWTWRLSDKHVQSAIISVATVLACWPSRCSITATSTTRSTSSISIGRQCPSSPSSIAIPTTRSPTICSPSASWCLPLSTVGPRPSPSS